MSHGWALLPSSAALLAPRSGRRGAKVALQLPAGTSLDKLRFRKGDAVVLSEANAEGDRPCRWVGEGTVQQLSEQRLVLQLQLGEPPSEAELARGSWRVDVAANRLASRRQLQALHQLCSQGGLRGHNPLLLALSSGALPAAASLPSATGPAARPRHPRGGGAAGGSEAAEPEEASPPLVPADHVMRTRSDRTHP